MSTLYNAMQGLNQGQAIVAGWNNQATLKNITAYVGTDGNPFLPIDDRNYTPGVTRRIPGGYTFQSGYPMVRFISPAITHGQIKRLVTAFGLSSNVTVRYHRYNAVGITDTLVANAVLNLNVEQLPGLQRHQNAYVNYTWELVIVEVL